MFSSKMSTFEENDSEGSSDTSDIDVDGICAGMKCIYSIESSDSDESMCDRNTTRNCQEANSHQSMFVYVVLHLFTLFLFWRG